MAIKTQMGVTEWLLLLVLAVIWGGSFFFVEVALEGLGPLAIVTLRVGLAAVALWLVVALRRIPLPRSPAAWLAMAVMGVVNNVVPFSLLVWGQTVITGGLASILNATTPLFTVVIAGLLLPDERVTRLKVAGVAVGFLGAVLVIGPGELLHLGTSLWAQLACIAAGLCYAVGGVYGRRFKGLGVPPVLTAAGMVTVATLVLAPVTLAVERPWELAMPGWSVWGSVAAMALLSTALAYLLYFRVLDSAGATNLMLVTFLIPVSAILLGWLVLGERLEPLDFAGMAVISLGLALVDGRLLRRFPGRAA